jgi:hypothetical protein
MSDEQHKSDEQEPRKAHALNDEPDAEHEDDDVEAHMRRGNLRLDSPRNI